MSKMRAVGTVLTYNSQTIGSIKTIGEVKSTADEIDVTTLDSTGGYKEFLQGFKDGGEVQLDGFFDGTAGQVALNAASSGARIAIVQENESAARTVASEAVEAYMQNVGMGITYEGDIDLDVPNSWQREEICTCVVTVKVHTLMPMPADVFGGISSEISVTRGIPMMIERGV